MNSEIKHILSLNDLSRDQILSIVNKGIMLKKKKEKNNILSGRTLGLLFQKPSTRTRVSFEVAMYHFGGNAIYLNSNDLQLSRGETIADTAMTLSLYLDCLVARIYLHTEIIALAMNSNIPIINGLSNLHHPCQILADLMTILEHKNRLKNLTLAWVGDGNNVCNDLLIACSKLGIDIKAAIPKGFEPPQEVLDIVELQASNTNTKFEIVRDPRTAAENADIVVTDTFISIGDEKDGISKRSTFFPKYQVNRQLMSLSKKNSIFMHCLPAKRGEEVTSEVIDGDSSVIWDEAENRLHVQKSVLLFLLK